MSETASVETANQVNDTSKEEIIKHIFGDIGELIEGIIPLYVFSFDFGNSRILVTCCATIYLDS